MSWKTLHHHELIIQSCTVRAALSSAALMTAYMLFFIYAMIIRTVCIWLNGCVYMLSYENSNCAYSLRTIYSNKINSFINEKAENEKWRKRTVENTTDIIWNRRRRASSHFKPIRQKESKILYGGWMISRRVCARTVHVFCENWSIYWMISEFCFFFVW